MGDVNTQQRASQEQAGSQTHFLDVESGKHDQLIMVMRKREKSAVVVRPAVRKSAAAVPDRSMRPHRCLRASSEEEAP